MASRVAPEAQDGAETVGAAPSAASPGPQTDHQDSLDRSRIPKPAVLAGLLSPHEAAAGDDKKKTRSIWQITMPPGSELCCFLFIVIVVLVIVSRQ